MQKDEDCVKHFEVQTAMMYANEIPQEHACKLQNKTLTLLDDKGGSLSEDQSAFVMHRDVPALSPSRWGTGLSQDRRVPRILNSGLLVAEI